MKQSNSRRKFTPEFKTKAPNSPHGNVLIPSRSYTFRSAWMVEGAAYIITGLRGSGER